MSLISQYVAQFASGKESRHVFDKLFRFALKNVEFKPTGNKIVDDSVSSLEKIRLVHKLESVDIETLKGNSLLTWNPVKALEYIIADYEKNFYPADTIAFYLDDEHKIKKVADAGLSNDVPEVCLARIIDGSCRELIYGQHDLSEQFKKSSPSHFIEIIKEFGECDVLKGYDMEFVEIIKRFNSLGANAWNQLKLAKSIACKNSSGLNIEDQNELFEIFGGNYDLIKEVECDDCPEAVSLVTNKAAYNKLSANKQKLVRATLGYNQKKFNNAVIADVTAAYSRFKAYQQAQEQELVHTLKQSMSGGYYSNNDQFKKFSADLKKTIASYNFSSITKGADFIVHNYIPLLNRAKSDGIYNNFNHIPFMNSNSLCVLGGGAYVEPKNDVVEVEVEKIVERQVEVERPVEVERVVEVREVEYIPVEVKEEPIEFIEEPGFKAPVESMSGAGKKAQQLIDDLKKLQIKFNEEFSKEYRKIIAELGKVDAAKIKSGKIDTNLFTALDRILIKSNKTCYKISGVREETKKIALDFVEVCDATATRLSMLSGIAAAIRALGKLVKQTVSAAEKLRNTYTISDRERYDELDVYYDEIKVATNFTQEEFASIYDNFNRILMLIQECNQTKIVSNTEEILKKYISDAKDKNKTIDEFFDFNKAKFEKYAKKHRQMEKLVEMRLIIDNELRKAYKWLNNTFDTTLGKIRLNHLNEHVLTKKVVDRISKNKIMFNPAQSELKIHKLNNKLMSKATEPEYYRSYFKIFKLASKIVDAYGVLDFMELLYKELEIVGSDFKWGEFKQGMTHFLVSNLIGLDLFETHDVQGRNYSVYRGWAYNATAGAHAIQMQELPSYPNHFTNHANQQVLLPAYVTEEETRAGRGGNAVPDNATIQRPEATESMLKKIRYIIEVFGFNELIERFTLPAGGQITYNPHDPAVGAAGQIILDSYQAGFVDSITRDNSPIKFGFSIRHVPDRSYVNGDIKKISEHIFKSLYTPVLQAFDKFNKQRTTLGNNAFYNVNQLLMGGADEADDKMEGASVFDYIEDPTESFYIIKEAGKFYTIGTHILLHYCRHFNTNHHFLKPGKLNRLSKIKKLNKEQIAGSQYDPLADDEDLKETIMALNSYWKNSNHTLEGAIKVLMKEINTALFFDENGKDIDEFYKIKTDDIIGEINVAMTNNHNILNKECNVTFIDEYLGLADKKLKESTSTENGFGIIKKIVSNKIKEDNTDDMYVAFCDTVLTPISLISQHYQLMLLEFVIDICGLSAELVGQVRQMSRALIDLFGDRSFEKKSLNGGQKMFASNSVLLAYPEIVDQNMTPAQVFGYFTERYNKHVEEFLTVASKFPIISDVKMKTFIEAAKTQFNEISEQIVENIKREANAIYQEPIENINFSNKFIPVAKNANKKIEKIVKYVNDTSYPFNPVAYNNLTVDQLSNSIQCFDSELNNNYSITRFVCLELTHAMQNGFLPDSFVKKLLETPLYDSVFKALPQQNMKINDKDNKPAFEVENADPLVSLLVHVSRSQIAVQSTLNLVVSKTVINNLCALIPFLIKTLQNYLRVCKKHAYKIGETEIQSKLECEILIDVLKQFYGEISKLGQKKEFGELTTNDKHGYFTDNLIDEQNGNDNDVRSLDYCHQPITYEWIMNYNNVSDEVPSYDRFKSYHENVLKKINDDYFIKNFKERIIPILADIKMKNMMSCINVMFNQENVNGVMLGGTVGGKAMTGGFLPSEIADWAAKYVIYLRQNEFHNSQHGNDNAIMDGRVIKQNTEFDMQAFLFKCGIPINCTGIGAGAADVVNEHESIFGGFANGTPQQLSVKRYSHYIYEHKTILGGPAGQINVHNNVYNFAANAAFNYAVPGNKGTEYFEQEARTNGARWMAEHTYYFLHVLPTLIWNYVTHKRDDVKKAIMTFANTIDRNVMYDLMNDVLKICVIHNENNANPAVTHFDINTTLFDQKDSTEALATKCLYVAHYIFNKMKNRNEQRGRPFDSNNHLVTQVHVDQINQFYRAFDVFTIFAAAYRIDLLIDIYSKYDASVKTNEWLRAVESIIKTQQTSHVFINPDYMLKTEIDAVNNVRTAQPKFSIAHCDDNRRDITTLTKNENKILSQLDLLLNKVYVRDKTQSTRKTISNVDKIIKAIGLDASEDKLLALISSILTLEDTIYQSDTREGAEYKQFLRYGLGYNNWALADACYHANGGDRHVQDPRIGVGEHYSTEPHKRHSENSVNYNIFSTEVSPAIIARTIQLGYNLCFHDNALEWDNEMGRLYGGYINRGSIFDDIKNKHNVFKGDHSKWLHLKLSDDVYLSFESLIEESYSTTKLQPINISGNVDNVKYNRRLKELIDNLDCFSSYFMTKYVFTGAAGAVPAAVTTLYYTVHTVNDLVNEPAFTTREGGLFYNQAVLGDVWHGNENLYNIAVNGNIHFEAVIPTMNIGLNFCHRTSATGPINQSATNNFANVCTAAAAFANTKVALAGLAAMLSHTIGVGGNEVRRLIVAGPAECKNETNLSNVAITARTYANFVNGLGPNYPFNGANNQYKWSNVELFVRHMYQTIVLSDIIKGNTVLNNPMTFEFTEDKPVRTFDITTGTAVPGVTRLSVRVPEIVISINNKGNWERKSILNYNTLIRMNNNMKTIDNLIKLLKKPTSNTAAGGAVAAAAPDAEANNAGFLRVPAGSKTWKEIIQDPKIFNKANYDLIQDSIMMIDNYKLCTRDHVLYANPNPGANTALSAAQKLALGDLLNRDPANNAPAVKVEMFRRVFGGLPFVTNDPGARGAAVAGTVDYTDGGNNVADNLNNNYQLYGFATTSANNVLFTGNGGDIRFLYGLVYLSAITEHTYFGKNTISDSYDYVRVSNTQLEDLSKMYSGFNLEGFDVGLKYRTIDAYETRINLGNVIPNNKYISISQVLPFLTSIPSNTYNRLWKDHCLIYDNYTGFNVYDHNGADTIAKDCKINLEYDVDQTIPYIYRHIANMISPDYKYDSLKHTLHENLIIEATKKDNYTVNPTPFNRVSYHRYDNNNVFKRYRFTDTYKCRSANSETPAVGANVGSVTGLLYFNNAYGIANTWYDAANAAGRQHFDIREGSMNNLVLRTPYAGAVGSGANFGHAQINVLYKIHPLMTNPEFLKAHYDNQFDQPAANCAPYYGAANITGLDKANSYHTRQFNHILNQSRVLSQILGDKSDTMVRINETSTYTELPALINELTYMYIPTEETTHPNILLSAAENYARLIGGLDHNRDVITHSIYPILKIKDNIKHHDMKLRLKTDAANTNMLKFAPELNYYLSKDIPSFSETVTNHKAGTFYSNSAVLDETLGDFDTIYENFNKHQYNMILAQKGPILDGSNKVGHTIYDYGLKPDAMKVLIDHDVHHNNYNDIKISDTRQMTTNANTLNLSRLIHRPQAGNGVVSLANHGSIHNVYEAYNPANPVAALAAPGAGAAGNRAGCDVFNFTVSAYTYQYRFPSMVRRIHSYSKIKDINAIPNVDGPNGIMGLIKSVGEKILNVFDWINTPMRTVRDKRINKAMFGGFSLIENVGIKKINRIYGDANKQIVLQTLFNEQNASTDLAENILSYFKNQMMILTPSFDRHMYMNILYNSKLFSEARRSIDLQIDDPAHGLFDDNNLGVMSNFNYHTAGVPANNRNLYWAPVMNGERPLRDQTADTIDRNLLKNTPVAGGTNHSSYYELYQSIRELDRYNGLMYALIGYMKNLEYYDMEFDTEVPYNVQYDKSIKPVGI